jgi:hypothetical protein
MAGTGCFDEVRVQAFIAGTVSDVDRPAAERHLDECESCRELVAALAQDKTRDEEPAPAAADPTSLAPGTVVSGRFRVIEPLGAGATAMTYRVADEQLGVESALKVIVDSGAGAMRRVARELVIARKLNHPNVCRVHDVGRTEDLDFFSMELVSGETLEKTIQRGIPEADVPAMLDQICAGIEAAHAQEIVHRDLKPSNILVEAGTGRVVLMDFGLAADLDMELSRGHIVGTPAYWAPEQARGEDPSKASDVYSLGLIAYRMFARKPFKLSDEAALTHVPRRYRATIARCLEAAPSARFPDGAAVRRALAKAQRGSGRNAAIALGIALAVIGVIVIMQRTSTSANNAAFVAAAPATQAPSAVVVAPTVPSATLAMTVDSSPSAPAPAPVASAVASGTSIGSAAAAPRTGRGKPVAVAPRASTSTPASATSGATKVDTDLLYKQ